MLAGLIGSSGVAACESLQGLSGGTIQDAGDASPSTGTAAADGAPDAVPAADADAGLRDADAPPRFCQADTGAAFCSDFEEGGYLDGWTLEEVGSRGAIQLASDRASSGKRSVKLTLARRESEVETVSLVHVTLGSWRSALVRANVYLVAPAWKVGDVNAGILGLLYGSQGAAFDTYVSVGELYTAFGSASVNSPPNAAPFPTGRWTPVEILLRLVGATGTASYKVDGSPTGSTTFPVPAPGPNPKTALLLGVHGFNKPCPAFEVYYDDVTITLDPP